MKRNSRISKIKNNIVINIIRCLCIFLCGMLLVGSKVNVNAKTDKFEPELQKVLTRSNLRGTPSGNGNWVATIPENAIVIVVAQPQDGYVLVIHGEYKGYIYGGCITKSHDKTFADYCDQFPDLDIESINKSFGVKYKEDDSKDDKDTKEDDDSKDDKDSDEDKDKDNDEQDNNQDSDDNGTVSDNTVELEDKYAPEYFEVETRDDKKIVGPEEKVYNGDNGDLYSISIMSDSDIVGSKSGSNGELIITAKTLAAAKLREYPSHESKVVLTVPAGATVKILDEGDNGAVHVSYASHEGYIFSRCLDYSTTNNYGNDPNSRGNGDGRMIVSSDGTAVFSLAVNETNNSKESEETKEQDSQLVVVSTQSLANSDDEKKEVIQKEISARVNMRSLPSSDSARILSLPIGANVEIIGQSSGGYSLVQYNGMQGYVPDDLMVDVVQVNKLGSDAILFECTAYCSCRKCCGSYSPEVTGREPHTATGTIPAEGRTIAVDPTVIHYGTKVYIEGMGTYVAEDCGGGVKGNHIDIYFESHEDAVRFGRRRLYVSIQR